MMLYGSVAKGMDTATSDIDLMVLSTSLPHGELFTALESATRRLGRRVNPTVYAPEEFALRVKDDNTFLKRILSQPRLWLIGEEHSGKDFARLTKSKPDLVAFLRNSPLAGVDIKLARDRSTDRPVEL